MEWNPETAERAGQDFAARLRDDMTLAELRELWRAAYLVTGHKILARHLLRPVKEV